MKNIKNHIEKRAKDIDSSQKSYAMALHHVKGSSNWLTIRETQMKATLRYSHLCQIDRK